MFAGRLIYIVNVDWFFISHRLPLAREALREGWDVRILTTDTGQSDFLKKEGFPVENIPLGRALQNPFLEAWCFLLIIWKIIRLRPDVVHCIAFKAVILGGLAARLAGVPRLVLAVTGFGSTFLKTSLKVTLWRKAIFALLGYICRGAGTRVILQNRDDIEEFVGAGIMNRDQITLIRGSGVDLAQFTPVPEPGLDEGFQCVLPARLLKDKGIEEFAQAARMLREKGTVKEGLRMILVGGQDPHNQSAITREQIAQWEKSGFIKWWDHRKDMEEVYARCHVVILPSYREGLPKVLIEAGAVARPSITTDVPGCREIIRDGVNGLIVPVRDPHALAAAIEKLYLQPDLRRRMGLKAREIVAGEYTLDQVLGQTMTLYRQ